MSDTTITRKQPPSAMTRDFAVTIDRAALETREAGDDRIPIAISSEQGVERWDWYTGERYVEILDHAAKSVDLSRATRGLPLLLDHNTREQVGRVEDITVDGDRVLRGVARFSSSQRGQEIRRDFVDGIRTDISVGYATSDDYEQTKRADDKVERRYRKWTPYEVSSVPIPADPTVGVGRAAPEAVPPVVPTPAPTVVVVANPADEARSHRMSDQGNGAGTPAAPGFTREAVIRDQCEAANLTVREQNELIASGKSIREVAEVIEAKRAKATVPAPANVTLTASEQRTYSIVRALNTLVEGKARSGFEFEVSDDIAKRYGKSTDGVFVPTSISAEMPGATTSTRSQLSIAAGAGKGTESKFTEYGGFLDLLRNNMVVQKAGAQMLGGLQGDVSFVNQSAAGTFSWGTEVATGTLSSATIAARSMAPKNATSATSFSRQLLRQSVLDVENFVRQDIAAIHARGIDLAALHGTGASSQPTGLTVVSGTNSVVGGTNGAVPTYANVIDLVKEVASDNGLDGSLAFVVHPLIAARLAKTETFATTNGQPIWTGSMLEGQVAGFRALASTQVVTGQTKGSSTDCSPILFGDWSSLVIGEWGAMELVVDPYSLGVNLIKISSVQMIDIFVRYPQKFAIMADARI